MWDRIRQYDGVERRRNRRVAFGVLLFQELEYVSTLKIVVLSLAGCLKSVFTGTPQAGGRCNGRPRNSISILVAHGCARRVYHPQKNRNRYGIEVQRCVRALASSARCGLTVTLLYGVRS